MYGITGVDCASLVYADIPTTTSNPTWDAAVADWSATGYRLPTEMEWQWAAMGATSDRSLGYTGTGIDTQGCTKYAGSVELSVGGRSNIGNYAWYASNGTSTTHPAGLKLPNELGLHDMTGNVCEWCSDWYAATYPTPEITDYRGPASGTARTCHGSGFTGANSGLRIADRGFGSPTTQSNVWGFRVFAR